VYVFEADYELYSLQSLESGPGSQNNKKAQVKVPQGCFAKNMRRKKKEWQVSKLFTQQAPFPAGKGGGIGPKRKTG
jgi:hypothetical protein